MSSNVFSPRTRQQDQSQIVRKMDNFSGGLSLDKSAIEVPTQYVSELVNARGHEDSVRGRYGTSLWSETELPNNGTSVVAHVTTVYPDDTNDAFFYDNDNASVTLVDGNPLKYLYRGEWITSVGKDFTAAGGYKLLAFNYGDNNPLEITEVILLSSINASYYDEQSDTEYYVLDNQIYAYHDNVFLLIPSNDSIPNNTAEILRIEEFIVIFTLGGIFTLEPYDMETGNVGVLTKMNVDLPEYRLSSTTGDNDVVINTPFDEPASPSFAYNYVYTYSTFTNHYNQTRNTLKDNDHIILETPPFYDEDPTVDDETFSVYGDTVSIVADENSEQWATIQSDHAINRGAYLMLTTDDTATILDWKEITDSGTVPYFVLEYDGLVSGVFPDFSRIQTYDDIAAEFTVQLQKIDSTFSCKYVDKYFHMSIETEYITIAVLLNHISVTPTAGVNLMETTGPNGTDEFLGWPTDFYMIQSSPNSLQVAPLMYPTDRKNVTHYSVYRSKNIYSHTLNEPDLLDPSIANSPTQLGWIDDIPVCEMVELTSVNGDFNESTWDVDQDQPVLRRHHGEIGIRVKADFSYVNRGSYLYDINMENKTVGTSWGASVVTEQVIVYGVEDVYAVSSTGNTEIFDGVEYTEIDVAVLATDGGAEPPKLSESGDLLFFLDGSYTPIRCIVDPVDENITLYYVLSADWTFSTETIMTGFRPTYRGFTDTTTDNYQNGSLSVWPMSTMYYQPMTNSSIVAYNKSVIMMRDEESASEYNYSTTVDFRGLGYHNKAYQHNSSLQNPITAIDVAGDQFGIFTSESTHTVNPAQGFIDSNIKTGLSYVLMPDPVAIDAIRGVSNESHIADGPNGSLFVVTSEPAVRVFDGQSYSEDYSDGTIRHGVINKLNQTIAMSYNTRSGLTIWGDINNE